MKKLLLLAILPFVFSCNGQEKFTNDIELMDKNFKPESLGQYLKENKIPLEETEDGKDKTHENLQVANEKGSKTKLEKYDFTNLFLEQKPVAKFQNLDINFTEFLVYDDEILSITARSCADTLRSTVQKTIDNLNQKYGAGVKITDYPEHISKGVKVEKDLLYYWQTDDKLIGVSYHSRLDLRESLELEDQNLKTKVYDVYEIYILNKPVITQLQNAGTNLRNIYGNYEISRAEHLRSILYDMELKKKKMKEDK